MRGDLSEGIGHFRRAAGHGVRKMGAKVRPKFASARVKAGPGAERVRGAAARGWGLVAAAALVPLAAAAGSRVLGRHPWASFGSGPLTAVRARAATPSGRARGRAAGKKKSTRSGTSTKLLVGLLGAGALAGAAGAVKFYRSRSPETANESLAVEGLGGDARSVRDAAGPRDGQAG